VTHSSAAFIGEQTLLIQCCEYWLSQGHTVQAVVSDNDAIAQWAANQGLDIHSPRTAYADALADAPYDYLFSITNLRVLPTKLLAQPAKGAINFHDGPLPAYAGLNVPAWAVANDESEHGVTFHRMTDEVDAGDILCQQLFPLAPDETAFSLNVKCYQHAEELFRELVTVLGSDQATALPGSGRPWSYFGLGAKPAASGVVNFNADAETLSALLRSLDFGPYASPLSYPKVALGDGTFVLVRGASVMPLDGVAPSTPGTIVDVSANGTTVACNGGFVHIPQFERLNGEVVEPYALRLSKGAVIGGLDAADANLLRERDAVDGRNEGYWLRRLQLAEPAQLPYARILAGGESAGERRRHTQLIDADVVSSLAAQECMGNALLNAASLYIARICGKAEITLATYASGAGELPPSVSALRSGTVPLQVEIVPGQSSSEFLSAQGARIAAAAGKGGFNADLYLREPTVHHATRSDDYQVLVRLDGESMIAASCPLILTIADDMHAVEWGYSEKVFDQVAVEQMSSQFAALLADLGERPHAPAAQLNIVSAAERELMLGEWNATGLEFDRDATMHALFETCVSATPDVTALIFEGARVSYADLNARANQIANHLLDKGYGNGQVVGVLVDRSIDMVAALFGVLKSGSAYLPLDPVYPHDRLKYMVEDSGAVAVVMNDHYDDLLAGISVPQVRLESDASALALSSGSDPQVKVSASDLGYLIYTSGSTGKPKGVMVEHRHAVNFFAGMDGRVEPGPGVWLAVTSISFDISVLELFWTLGRGLTVLLYSDEKRQQSQAQKAQSKYPAQNIDFSLFYWNVADEASIHATDKYRLLLEGARFADANDFKAVWNPERHFAAFGGLFPNPAVTLAALSTITTKVHLRAGSCVVPLHSPIRVAEEYSVIDNLSNGRVGIAAAAGWAPPDFAIKPDGFENAKGKMFDSIEVLRQLWRGETVPFAGPTGEVPVRTLPRPIQSDIPIWVTTAGNIDSFTGAARIGAGVLTHLLGQTVEEVGEKVAAYRKAWKEAGHPGNGTITLMLHTFVGPNIEEVEAHVRAPMKSYLKSAMFLVKSAAWNFPTFKKMSDETGKSLDEFFETISDQDLDDLLDFAFARYFHTSGLFGDYEMCIKRVDECKSIGVDEIACLIDFGIDTDLVLKHLPYLNEVRARCVMQAGASAEAASDGDFSLPALLRDHDVSHLQCTPSMAAMLSGDPDSRGGLAPLRQMMVGGEAFPADLAKDLRSVVGGRVTNMYGPTETTIWSSTHDIGEFDGQVSIGRPIANTQLYIVDENLQPLPIGVPGELLIGGEGVVRGYHERPDLNAERFVNDPWAANDDARMYRTGDLAKFESDGTVSYLGRLDHQVKVRGYRIELGEVESLLLEHPSVRQGVVVLREDVPGDKRLVAYLCSSAGERIEPEVLREHLLEHVPDFMVPSFFVSLPSLPLTPNGKVSRNDLPAPKTERTGGDLAPPSNEWEALIAQVWAKALGVSEVGTRDNFFDIGGHSLLAISILKELREHQKISKPIQMTDLFRYTTIEQLAQFIASEDTGAGKVEEGQARAEARRAALARRRRPRR
jgi:natural product biosynthesis luciferase-like monooxygenase protein